MAKINVSEHMLVPKHTKLSEKEKEQLLKEFNITTKQLPKIKKKDPAIKHLDVKINDIIKIERKSPTSGKTTYYRVVI